MADQKPEIEPGEKPFLPFNQNVGWIFEEGFAGGITYVSPKF